MAFAVAAIRAAIFVIGTWGVFATTADAQPSRQAPAVAVSADLSIDDGRTRLTVALSGAVDPRAFTLERPDRAIIELPNVNCQLPPELGRRRAGLVTGVRCGLVAPGRSRLVADLATPATVSRLEIVDGHVDGVKLLVAELTKADRETFRRAARSPASEPEATGSISLTVKPDARPLVAIDAGHGGIDPGATAATGDLEKDIVLAFAQTLRAQISERGFARVVMIRDGDVFVPLDERVKRARAAGADLFVSIHADSISSPTVRGATIYTGAERATDLESASLAERENASDAVAGLSASVGAAGVSDILQELMLRETRGFSHRFAATLHHGLGPVMRFSARPHREAGFKVLRAPDMTAALVELGYLSNAKDANLLLSDDWRTRTSAAMAAAIERFLGTRVARRAAVSP